MLEEAKRLNSELGHHVRRASFSKHLTGRFYQNNSLESHQARSDRISKMRKERRRLEKFLKLEEKKIHFLEQILQEKQTERRKEEEKRRRETLSCIKIQTIFRRSTCINQLVLLRVERDIKLYLIVWLQSRFRGRQDRRFIQSVKDYLAKIHKESDAAIVIQTQIRIVISRIRLDKIRQQVREERNVAATKLQAILRGYNVRYKFKKLRREEFASIEIQRLYRGYIGRKIRARIRKRKPKRIPLHERRYSSYGAATALDVSRKLSISIATSSDSCDVRTRRASLPGWDVLRNAVAKNSANIQSPIKQTVDRVPQRFSLVTHSDSSLKSNLSLAPDITEQNKNDTKLGVISANENDKDSDDDAQTRHSPLQHFQKTQNAIVIEDARESQVLSEDFKRDRIIKSQKSAAKRALRSIQKKKQDREDKARKEALRKLELEKLEENRRIKIKEQLEAKKEKEAKKKDDTKSSFVICSGTFVKKKDFTPVSGKTYRELNVTAKQESKLLILSQHVVVETSFLDCPFEDDCFESEFDLD